MFKKICQFIKTEIWWNITATVYWWGVALKRPENIIRHPEKDYFNAYSEDGKWVYYDDYITGETYKVYRQKER